MTQSTVVVAEKGDVEITELEKISPTRVDGVTNPANGFPILMMKSIDPAAAGAAAKATAACGCAEGCACCSSQKAAAPAKKPKKPGAGKKAKKGATIGDSDTNMSSNSDTTDVITKAVAEATAASEGRFKTLEADLAKARGELDAIKALPIPGGPLLVTPLTQRATNTPGLEKAARLRAIAAQTSDPETKRSYEELAAREQGAPITKD